MKCNKDFKNIFIQNVSSSTTWFRPKPRGLPLKQRFKFYYFKSRFSRDALIHKCMPRFLRCAKQKVFPGKQHNCYEWERSMCLDWLYCLSDDTSQLQLVDVWLSFTTTKNVKNLEHTAVFPAITGSFNQWVLFQAWAAN